jgi:hypothetical protein
MFNGVQGLMHLKRATQLGVSMFFDREILKAITVGDVLQFWSDEKE